MPLLKQGVIGGKAVVPARGASLEQCARVQVPAEVELSFSYDDDPLD